MMEQFSKMTWSDKGWNTIAIQNMDQNLYVCLIYPRTLSHPEGTSNISDRFSKRKWVSVMCSAGKL